MDRTPLDVEELRAGVVGRFWERIDVVASTGSTNADLLAVAAAEPDADRRVLIAEHQASGRGRHARVWVSPPHAQLAMSVLLRMPGIAPNALGWLPLLAGIAVVDTLVATAGVDARLKWPNDVQIAGRKVSGILAEVAPGPGSRPIGVVIGIGLNVSLTVDELPVPHATSLTLAGADVTRRETLIRALLRQLDLRWTQWYESNWDTIDLAADYRARCSTIGQSVRAELPAGDVCVGVATGVDGDGRLEIRTDAGTALAVSAGDVTHLRPA